MFLRMSGQQPQDPGVGWEGHSPGPLPTSAETDLPVGQKGGVGPREAKTIRGSFMDGDLGGKRKLWMGSRAGGAQVLLSSSCLLLLWHLNLLPCLSEPPALHFHSPHGNFPAKARHQPRNTPSQRGSIPVGELHVMLPKGNPKKTRQDRQKAPKRKPKKDASGQTESPSARTGSCTHTAQQMGSDSRRVGQERGSQPQAEPGPSVQANPTAWLPRWGWGRVDLLRGAREKLRERI